MKRPGFHAELANNANCLWANMQEVIKKYPGTEIGGVNIAFFAVDFTRASAHAYRQGCKARIV
jgi:hypothetical protein